MEDETFDNELSNNSSSITTRPQSQLLSITRPRDLTRVLDACEACEEIRVRKQREREMRAALEVASIPFEAEEQANE